MLHFICHQIHFTFIHDIDYILYFEALGCKELGCKSEVDCMVVQARFFLDRDSTEHQFQLKNVVRNRFGHLRGPGLPKKSVYTSHPHMKTIGQYLTHFCRMPKNKISFISLFWAIKPDLCTSLPICVF
jgi:hypothetical protein